jgi:hypothetical protein
MLAQRFTPRLRAGFAPRWSMQGTLGITNGLPMVITPRGIERDKRTASVV